MAQQGKRSGGGPVWDRHGSLAAGSAKARSGQRRHGQAAEQGRPGTPVERWPADQLPGVLSTELTSDYDSRRGVLEGGGPSCAEMRMNMKRRLRNLLLLGVAVPLAGRAAVAAAERLEADNGSSRTTRSLRRAGSLAKRRWR
jgi:hypothetical protein